MRANDEVVEEEESSDAKSTGVNIEVANATKEVLKNKKYTDKDSGRQIAFSTAYGRRNPKAVKDFGDEYIKQMEKMRGEKIDQAPSPDQVEERLPVDPELLAYFNALNPPKKDQGTKPKKDQDAPEDDGQQSIEQIFEQEVGDLENGLGDWLDDLDYEDLEGDSPEAQVKQQIVDEVLTDPSIGMGAEHIKSVRGVRQKNEARKARRKEEKQRYLFLSKDQRKEMEAQLRSDFDKETDPDKKLAIGDSVATIRAVSALQGDIDVSESFLVNMINDSKLSDDARDNAFDALTENLNPSNRQNETSKREQRKSVLTSLSTESWTRAVGGTSGPLGKLVEKLDPNYCPASPENKDKGGKVLGAGEKCPAPLSDEARDRLENFITTMALDGYSMESTSYAKEKGEDGKKKERKSSLKDEAVKDYMQALIDGDSKKLSKLETGMRSDQIASYENKTPSQKAYEKRMRELHDNWSDSSTLDQVDEIFETELDYGTNRSASKRIATRFLNTLFIDRSKYSGGLSMLNKRSTYNYQSRAENFQIGMRVFPFYLGNANKAGIVRAVFPAIGMVDVQFPHGTSRYPVEDLVVDTSGDVQNLANEPDSVPGGLGTVPVSGGIYAKSASNIASRYMSKSAIYWHGIGRKYRQRGDEDKPCCPRCKEVELKNTTYKRRSGVSERLLGCPSCLFLIKHDDLF